MSLIAFISAVLALLMAPGPTNTLIALAGAASGLRGATRLLAAELAGYLSMVVPLTWIGAALTGDLAGAAVALKLAAGVWVMYLAITLWHRPAAGKAETQITRRRVYLTTLLNPKALVFGLVLLPGPGDAAYISRLVIFCGLIAGVALVWGFAGSLTRSPDSGPRRIFILRRVAASWLAVVSLTLIGGVLST